MTPRARALLGAGCLLGAALLAPTPAHAQTPSAGEGPRLSAVLTLQGKPGDTGRLSHLAAGRVRPGALRALAPAGQHRAAALAFARARHLEVVRADAWSVTVSGPAAAMATAFGTSLLGSGQQLRTTDAAVPAVLRGDVTAVVGLDNRRLHRPHVTTAGADNPQTGTTLRAAYDVPVGWRGAGITVGVLSLSGWSPADLSTYAIHEGIPLGAGQVTEVPVDGADPHQLDGFGGEYEVALDSEAVLGAAPEAHQRLYFAPNTVAGVVSAFEQMATDAESGLLHVVTSSWGSCEKEFDQIASPAERTAYEQAIDRIVAAGATVFAASGDAGAYDCSYTDSIDNEAQVDFPASYANTVAVGGTTLNAGGPETGWHDPAFEDYLGDGSGGGESVEQALPSYQQGLVAGANRRLLPDVSADADPQSGLGIYVRSQGGWSTAGGTSLASPMWAGHFASALSSAVTPAGLGNILPTMYQSAQNPVSPGLVDVKVGNNGLFTAGVGFDQVTGLGVPDWKQLGAALLATGAGVPSVGPADPVARPAVSSDPVFRATPYWTRSRTVPVSVTLLGGSTYQGFSVGETLDNGCAGQSPTAPTTALLDPAPDQGEHLLELTAFDTGHVCHVVRTPVGYDTVKPLTTVIAELANTVDARVRITLGGTDAQAGIGSWIVSVHDPSNRIVFQATTASSTVIASLSPGLSYRVDAIAIDRAGNAGQTARTGVTVPYDDTIFTRTGSWQRVAGSTDFARSHLVSSTRGSTASRSFRTRALELILVRSAHGGYVDVVVDGRVMRLDLYAPRTTIEKVRVGTWAGSGAHTVRLVVPAAHRPGSHGSQVGLDGITVLP